MKTVIGVWKETFSLLKKYPKLTYPFIISAAANMLMLWIIYLTPQRPVSYVLAAPVRVFFGEKFLHYPFNLLILPKLFGYAEILLSALVGILMVALTVGMVSNVMKKEKPSLVVNLARGVKRYFALLGIWAINFIFIMVISKITLKLLNSTSLGRGIATSAIYFILVISVQVLFIYVTPLIIIKKIKLLSALKENLIILRKMFLPTVILVVLPAFLYMPIAIIKTKPVFLIRKLFPETILIVLLTGIIISIIVEFLVTVSTTVLFLKREAVR